MAKTELAKIHKALHDGRSEQDSESSITIFEAGEQHACGIWANFKTVFQQEIQGIRLSQQQATQRVRKTVVSGTSYADSSQFGSE